MPTRRHLLAAAALAALPTAARAAWPERPIRFVVPFAAGGNADLVGRVLAERMSPRLGQPIIVENRAGAGGSVGAEAVARATPDGYTLLIGSNGPLTVNPFVQARLGYDPLASFRPIGIANRVPHVIAVGPGLRVTTLREFLDAAKARPGQVGVGTAGVGSATHFTLESLAFATRTEFTHIPYRSGGAVNPDLVSGSLPAAMVELSGILPLHREGRVRILATATTARAPQTPDVPTFLEGGVPGFTAASYVGLLAPANLPRDIEASLATAFAAALADPAMRERFEASGGELVTGAETTPDGFATFLREETARSRQAAQAAGIKPE